MVSIWGLGFQAELGGSLAPGLWMHGGAQRVLEHCRPGVLFNDLSACNAYQNALAAAAKVTVPTTLILGERDMMTPAKAGKALAAALPNARTVVLPGAGHMMMVGAARRIARGAASLTLSFCLSMISAQTWFRVCREGNPVSTHRAWRGHAFPDHAYPAATLGATLTASLP